MSSTSSQGLTALGSALLGLSTIAITLRFYARHTQKTPVKSDDWIMIPCLLLFLGTTACTFVGVQKKVMGYPTPKDPQVRAETAEMTSKLYIAFDLLSTTTLGCIKVAALLFYRRIFCVLGRRNVFNALTLITTAIVALWTMAFLILSGLQCGTHFSALWIPHDYARYCHISYPFLLGLTVSDFLLDVWIICLPLPQIWTIQTSLRRRFALMGVFLLAFVGLAACIARLVVYVQIEHARGKIAVDSRLVNTKAIYLSVLEAGLSLIAVNLPSLWCLLNKVKPESVLRSVRSIISLRSKSSAGSLNKKGSHSPLSSLSKNGHTQSSSQDHLAHPETPSIETYAMHDMEDVHHRPQLPLGKIQITDSISQSAVHV